MVCRSEDNLGLQSLSSFFLGTGSLLLATKYTRTAAGSFWGFFCLLPLPSHHRSTGITDAHVCIRLYASGSMWILGVQSQVLMHVWWACCPSPQSYIWGFVLREHEKLKLKRVDFFTIFFFLCGLNSLQYLSISKLKSLVCWKTHQLCMKYSERISSSSVFEDCLIALAPKIASWSCPYQVGQ